MPTRCGCAYRRDSEDKWTTPQPQCYVNDRRNRVAVQVETVCVWVCALIVAVRTAVQAGTVCMCIFALIVAVRTAVIAKSSKHG